MHVWNDNVLFWNSCISKDLEFGFLMFWNVNVDSGDWEFNVLLLIRDSGDVHF